MTDQMQSNLRLGSRWLVLARAVWITLFLVVVGLWGVVNFLLTPVTLENVLFGVVMPLGFLAMAVLIFWRKSDDVMGLLVSMMLLFFGPYLLSGVSTELSQIDGWKLVNAILQPIAASVTVIFFYTFPDGRFVPRWTRWLAMLCIPMFFVTVFANLLVSLNDYPSFVLFATLIFVGIAAQVYRYLRASDRVQRQQIKWVVVGLFGPLVSFFWWLLVLLPGWVVFSNPLVVLLNSLLQSVMILFLPLTIAISILRYRLFDIDVIIRRTLIYGILTALLLIVYFGSVILLQQFFVNVTGQSRSSVVTIISTLAIAALFLPLRRAVQNAIDRRFYRRKYDAEKTIAALSARIQNEVDVDHVTGELMDVVDETLQPAHMSLWLKTATADRRPQTMESEMRP